MQPIIQASELLALRESEDLLIFDLSNGKDAKTNYNAKHLDGAFLIDLNTQLADIQVDAAIDGRHPLPTIEQFSTTLGRLGISPKSHVVIYDDKNGSNAAARFWWMLAAAGHSKVQVLNGGLEAAEKAGFPCNADVAIPLPCASYSIQHWHLLIAEMDEVEAVAQAETHIVIDVRDQGRYNGEYEPIDLIAGHIPGAINVPFSENLDENGLFLSPNALNIKYKAIFDEVEKENIIVHCGSGVTACHTLLAIAYSGLEIPKLYVGSWSEWSRNEKEIGIKKNVSI
jgi:thiosulfate/3-mercaptopyruvate sulfurtransferase